MRSAERAAEFTIVMRQLKLQVAAEAFEIKRYGKMER
jgi:hypothetical protein